MAFWLGPSWRRWLLAPAGVVVVVGGLWAGGNRLWSLGEERGRANSRIEFAIESIDTLRSAVETQRETVSELAVSVADVRATVEGLRDLVETQRVTVGDLAGTVADVRAAADGVRDSVESIGDAVDALDETVPLLVSCVIDLNGAQGLTLAYAVAEGAVDRETQGDNRPLMQLPDPPESCDQARDRARR
ncbi:MAG: hypothetical protein OXH75_23260 [Acidobacteria bacterium]|nr:hypothetical protein [Acidobacteriota bacterium]